MDLELPLINQSDIVHTILFCDLELVSKDWTQAPILCDPSDTVGLAVADNLLRFQL